MKVDYRPKYRGVLSVYIEDDLCCDIHTSIFGKFPDLPSDCESREALLSHILAKEYPLAKSYTLKRLAAQSLHSSQLRKLLAEKRVSQASIDQILQDCRYYLNDDEWVQSFIKTKSKRYGPRYIIAQLRHKGIDIEESCFGVQKDQIEHLLKTRYKSRNLGDFKEKQRVIAALMRKGFDFEQILGCIPKPIEN